MPLVPFRRFELSSAKTPGEVETAMRAAVQPKRFSTSGAVTRPFEGEVGNLTFEIQRTISYRNSFLPRIRGEISGAEEGSRIRVTMRRRPSVFVFMTIWLAGAAAACVVVLFGPLRKGDLPLTAFGPAIMLIFGWTMTAAGFTYESRLAEPLLMNVMAARPSTASNPPLHPTTEKRSG